MRSRNVVFTLGALTAMLVVAVWSLSAPVGIGPEQHTARAVALSEVKKLLASDAVAEDRFGYSVAMSGDTAVVGAYQVGVIPNDPLGQGTSKGAAYIFQRDEGGADNWGEVKKLTASDAQPADVLGWSAALSGDTLALGAIGEDTGGEGAGAVYLFQRDQGGANNWGEVTKLTASDAEAGANFGNSVAVSGDTIVVGTRRDTTGALPGDAYVFARDHGGPNNWGEVTKLTASDPEPDGFGFTVAVSADTAVVGAYREDAGGTDAGAAYVFGRDQGGADNWGEVRKITAADAQPGDLFGWSVALSDDTAIVGAQTEDTAGLKAGAAHVFRRDQGGANNWGEVTKLTASDAEPDDRFGYSVAVSGQTAVVGALNKDVGGVKAGAAYFFRRDQGGPNNWGEVTKLTASDPQLDDSFSWSVAVSSDVGVVGAPFKDGGGVNAGAALGGGGANERTALDGEATNAGAAYVFDLLQSKPTPTPTPDPDEDNDGCNAAQESGLDPRLGGRRDSTYFWDFIDQWISGKKDKSIVIGDIGAVVARFGANRNPAPGEQEALAEALIPPVAATGYHAGADRGGISGPFPWSLLPPDGTIVIGDIGAVVAQFGHSCA